MAHNPKLEVYQVWLKSYNKNETKTFRDFFLTAIPDGSTQTTNNDIFINFAKKFINKIDTDDFIADSRKKKAFAAYEARNYEEVNNTIHLSTELKAIEGVIEGGRYGQRRNKSSITNKGEKEPLGEGDIILDTFYFFLYTPFNSDLGILFLQSYSDDTISDVFTSFIENLFRHQGLFRKAKVEKFVPNRIKEEFKRGSNIKRFKFSSRFLFDQQSNNPIGAEQEEFTIKIEAVSKEGLPKAALSNWINAIGSKLFNSKRLEEFNTGKVYLKNVDSDKESPFDIDSDIDIKPVIYLDGRIQVYPNGLPNFEELKTYCFSILKEEIIPEMYITNEIEEH